MGFLGARMPARSVCLVTLSLSEAGPERFGRQTSVADVYHEICCLFVKGLETEEMQSEKARTGGTSGESRREDMREQKRGHE